MRMLGVDEKEVKGYVLRRSPRAMVKIPVVIKGIDKQGYEFEEGRNHVVSKYGARVSSVHQVEVDAILKLRLRDSQDGRTFVSCGLETTAMTRLAELESVHSGDPFLWSRSFWEDWG